MKKENSKTIRLGVFVTAGILLLIIGIYFIGQQQKLFSTTFRLSAIFTDVSGLQVGNNVRFSGINVGIVDYIEQITDSTVKVDLMVEQSMRKHIKKNARAIIGSDGLMGSKLLIISNGPPGEAQVENNDYIASTKPVNMDEVMNKLNITVSNAADISDDMSEIMDHILSGNGTIGKLFMDSSFAENIDQTIINLNQGTAGFKENMDAAKKSFLLRRFLKSKDKDVKNDSTQETRKERRKRERGER